MSQSCPNTEDHSALHPALLAQLRVLGLTADVPTPDGWKALLHHVSDAYFAREYVSAPPALSGDELADEDLFLFDASADAILIFNPGDERVINANKRACDMYEYDREEMIGLPMRSLSGNPASGRSSIDAVLQGAASTPDGWYRFETTQRRRGGSTVVVAIQARPIRYHGAQAVLTINHDVTELKRAQRALALSEERFEHIFNASPVAAAVIDSEGLILNANAAILELFEVDAENAVGHSVFELNIRSGGGTHPMDTLPMPPLRDYEARLSDRVGGNRAVLLSSEWLELGGNRHILLQMVDITERKRAEAELRASENRYRTLLIAVERQARETALLHQVRTVMARENNLHAVIRAVVHGIRDFFGYDLVSVYFKDGDFLTLQHEVGYTNVLQRIPLTSGVMARTLRTGEPVLLTDVNADSDYLSAIPGICSEVSVPLFVGDAPAGVLNVETIDEPLTAHDLDLFVALGMHVSLAIQRAHLFAELQASNDRYDALLRSVQEVVFQTDGDGHWTYLNPAWERQSGYTIEDTLGRNWLELMHTDDRFKLALHFSRLIRRHETYFSMRARFVTSEGTDRWCELAGRLNYSDDGVYLGAAGTATDSTERFHAEQREREQRQLAEALVANAAGLSSAGNTDEALKGSIAHIQRVIPNFNALRVALIDLGMGHMVTYALPDFPAGIDTDVQAWELEEHHLPLLETSEAHPGARSVLNLTPGALNLPGLEWVRAVLVAPLRSKDALMGYLYLDSIDPQAFNDSQAQWVQGFADQMGTALHNLRLRADTARHAQELELRVADRTEQFRQAKEQVETILDTSSDPIALITTAGAILQANHALRQVFQLPASDEAHLPPLPALMEDGSARMLTAAVEAALGGEPQRHKLVARRADGTTFPVDVAIDPLPGSGGSARSAVFSLHDITEFQALEDSLRTALEQERRLVDLKSRFGLMVSHEFRTPLATIQTSADLLLNYLERLSAERRTEALDTISRQVRHLTTMLDDILAISKADTVGMDFDPVPTNLAELCQSIVDEVRWVDNGQHDLQFTIAEDVIARPAVDRALLRRALMNLLSNAVKYSVENTVIEFSVRQQSDTIIMVIRDQGIGIPEAELPRLFESFFRASNVGIIPGTGLGLAIARRAIEAHDGEINVHSANGLGTTFTLYFPARLG